MKTQLKIWIANGIIVIGIALVAIALLTSRWGLIAAGVVVFVIGASMAFRTNRTRKTR